LSTSVPGGNSTKGNLITGGSTSTLNVTFDRDMLINTAPAGAPPTPDSFTGADVRSIMGPAGQITRPPTFSSAAPTRQTIPGGGTLDSTLTIPSYDGSFTIAEITVTLNATFKPDSGLTAVLVAPDGTTKVTLFSGVDDTGANFIKTTLDDAADSSITSASA